MLTIICLAALLLAESLGRELFVGSKCQNRQGVCTLITYCPIALNSVYEHGHHAFQRCGFDGDVEVVCCPTSNRNIPTSTEDPDNSNATPKIRGPQVGKSREACARYSELPIILTYHIIAGENAEESEFPHMAALGFFNEEQKTYNFICGGTLISERYVVTAAHCVLSRDSVLKIARLGIVNVPESVRSPDPASDYDVVNVTVHQKYNWTEKFNDIALVKLVKQVAFTDKIRPACLYAKNDDPINLVVTGWGATQLGGERSDILQKAALSAVTLDECNRKLGPRTNRKVIKSQICAADSERDSCQGDSGGPLQTVSNASSVMTLVGVTSYGVGCGSKFPGVYTRISSYVGWIEEIVWA